MTIKIYYEDSDIVVCEKPRGVISQDSEKMNMPSLLARQTNTEKIYTVHRLDIDTTGVMVYAKTHDARASLSNQVQNHDFKKKYLALVHGNVDSNGRFEDWLFYDRTKQKSYIVKKERNGVKKRILEYTTLKCQDDKSLVEVELFTGRTHQIRAQFASRKMPIVGDSRYGSSEKTFIHLHCKEISFDYNKERVVFSSLPDWQN